MANLTADGFAPLRIKRVVRETCDAVSLVLDVPESCSRQFRYKAGQFLTLRVRVDGRELRRCYSMSSAPAEEELRITVKRDPGGVVSNWLNDTAAEGHQLHATPPEGKFVLDEGVSATAPLIAFAGGSGITPIMSLVLTVLSDSDRPVKLFYANRARSSVIFADLLDRLAAAHPDRLAVRHHFDEDAGVVTAESIESFAGETAAGHFYICGPTPFMDTVEKTLLAAGVTKDRLHLERFTVAEIPPDAVGAQDTEEVVIELDRKTTTANYRKGDTLLQTARSAGLKAPYSCETGSCGTCMARIVEGSARMVNNDALDDDEVAEGWVVSCQALPTSSRVHMIYE